MIQLTDLSTWMTPSANESARWLLSKTTLSICSLSPLPSLPFTVAGICRIIPGIIAVEDRRDPLTSARTRDETFLRRTPTINRSIIFQTVRRQSRSEIMSDEIRESSRKKKSVQTYNIDEKNQILKYKETGFIEFNILLYIYLHIISR